MDILIVESDSALGALWQRHFARQGVDAALITEQEEATLYLDENHADVIILDLVLEGGSALAVADYANYRQPEARVIFVTSTSFFSDGSIFSHSSNAQAFVPADTPPDDLVAMAEHYGGMRA